MGLTSARPSYAIYRRLGARLTCFSPPPPCVDLLGPDGSWEDGAGHRGGVRLQAGVAPPRGGALVPQVSLDRGAGEVDPRAAARRHQPGGEQEPHHVGHPPTSIHPNHLNQAAHTCSLLFYITTKSRFSLF